MPRKKHDPCPYTRYVSTHGTILQHYVASGFVCCHDLVIRDLASEYVIEGTACCFNGLRLRVEKYISVVGHTDGGEPILWTRNYAYNLSLLNRGNIFRYDNSHAHQGHPSEHHKHSYDLESELETELKWTGRDDGWPTLGEVLQESQEWAWANIKRLEGHRCIQEEMAA